MRGLLILSLSCLALVSAADIKGKKRSYGFGIDTADVVPAVQYQAPFSSVNSVSRPLAYSADSVGFSSRSSIDSASYHPEIYPTYATGYSAPISTIGSSFYPTGYSAPISTIGSSSYPTGYSAPVSTIGSSSYPTGYSAPISTIGSSSYATGYSAPISTIGSSSYATGYSAPISTIGSSSYPTGYSAPISTIGSSSYPTGYSSQISTFGSSSYPTGYSAPISTIGSTSYPTGYSAPISTIGSSIYPTAYSAPQSYVKKYNVLNKAVPVYVPKPVPYEVTKTVQVPTPYTVTVAKPYSVPVKVNVPVEIPKPYEVKVEHRVPVPVPERVPIEIPRPYPVYKTKEVQVEIEKPVYVKEKFEVRVPVPKPYPVEVPTAVRVKVPHNVYVKEPQFVESAEGTYGKAYGVPNYFYGNSFQNLNVPQYPYEKTFSSFAPESKTIEDSITSNIQDHANVGKTLSQLSEQSAFSSQSAFDQAVHGLGNEAFDSSPLLQSNFGTEYSQGLPQSLESSFNGIPSYEEYRKLHQADGVVNEEKESVSVEAKSATKDSDKSPLEVRAGGDEPVVSDASTTSVSPAESETKPEEFNSEESTVPSKTTDIL